MNLICGPEEALRSFDIVAIGASLGGIKAVSEILSRLPQEFPTPIVVVQHVAPQSPNCLPVLLARRTKLAVRRAAEGLALESGAVYIAQPDTHLIVNAQRTLSLVDGPKIRYSRPAIDPLMRTVSDAYGERAIGVVLSGANGDGADGIRAIKRAGGTTFAQDRATSQSFRMPRCAIDTRCVDFVLPLSKIAPALIALTMVRGADRFFHVPARSCYPIYA